MTFFIQKLFLQPLHLLSYRSTKAFMVQRLEAEGAEVILKLCESFSVDGVELGSASRTNNYSFLFFLPLCLFLGLNILKP